MTIGVRPSCWHKNFGPNRLSAPIIGQCLNFFSSVTADFNISSALRWAIQDQWSSGFSCMHANFSSFSIKTGQVCFLVLNFLFYRIIHVHLNNLIFVNLSMHPCTFCSLVFLNWNYCGFIYYIWRNAKYWWSFAVCVIPVHSRGIKKVINKIYMLFEPRQANLCLQAFHHYKF